MLRLCSLSSASLSQPYSKGAADPTVALNRGKVGLSLTCLAMKGVGSLLRRGRGGQAAPPMWEHLQRSCRAMKLFFFIIESVGRNQGFLELKPKNASWP